MKLPTLLKAAGSCVSTYRFASLSSFTYYLATHRCLFHCEMILFFLVFPLCTLLSVLNEGKPAVLLRPHLSHSLSRVFYGKGGLLPFVFSLPFLTQLG